MDLLYKPQVKSYLQVAADKIFHPKCIWCDATDITTSSNRKALHVFAVIWGFFFCCRKTAILLFDRNHQNIG